MIDGKLLKLIEAKVIGISQSMCQAITWSNGDFLINWQSYKLKPQEQSEWKCKTFSPRKFIW